MTVRHDPCLTVIAPAPQAGLVGRLAGSLRTLLKAYRNRRAVARLTHFNEHMLRDIGLTQADVNFALQQPTWVDPSDHLVRSVQGRRHRHFRRKR